MLYKKYLQFKQEGRFDDVLQDLYEQGTLLNWRVPSSAGPDE